jgi:hypothetical protein
VLQGGVIGDKWHPLPDEIRQIEFAVRYHLEQYLALGQAGGDRLYVLEFQGYRQYLLFGHSRDILRRANEHQLAAAPHGFALLNGWASPGTDNAQPIESIALRLGGSFSDTGYHHRERFYDMPFERGVAIARAVFDARTA